MTTTSTKFIVTPLLGLLTAATVLSAMPPVAEARGALSVPSTWHYNFQVEGELHEAGSMSESWSPYFWLNSGGVLILKDGEGHTMQGRMEKGSTWQSLYERNNSLDTDSGFLPQNLFRLVTRSKWEDFTQSVRFKINELNLTDTPNRDGYSGILLMSRYFDGQNLYYAGLRQDGAAVIKKKSNGTYTTLRQVPVFEGTYNKQTNPNLIPMHQWMRLKMETDTLDNGSVYIALYLDENDSGNWKKIAEVNDGSGGSDGAPITGAAYSGIRTDYMDISFDDYIHWSF